MLFAPQSEEQRQAALARRAHQIELQEATKAATKAAEEMSKQAALARRAQQKNLQEAIKSATKAEAEAYKHRKIEIKIYKNGNDFNKDAQKRVKQGWELETQLATTQGVGLLGAATFGFFARSQGRITVTWIKPDLAAEASAGVLKAKVAELMATTQA